MLPWTEYYFGILVAAHREFESRVGLLSTACGAETEMVREAVRHLPDGFRVADLERMCPNVGRDMIRVVLDKLRQEGAGAVWRLSLNPGLVEFTKTGSPRRSASARKWTSSTTKILTSGAPVPLTSSESKTRRPTRREYDAVTFILTLVI